MTHGGQSKMMAVALIWESTKGMWSGEVDKSWKTTKPLAKSSIIGWKGQRSLPSWIERDLNTMQNVATDLEFVKKGNCYFSEYNYLAPQEDCRQLPLLLFQHQLENL